MMLNRSYSEGDIFYNSWDYTNTDKSTGKNGVDLAFEFLQVEHTQNQHLNTPKTPEKKKKKKKSKRNINVKEYDDYDNDEKTGTFIITPRNNAVNNVQNVDYNKATMKINSEGRSIIEYATLDQVVQLFSEQSQDMTYIQRLILAHGHFMESEELFSKFVEYFQKHISQSSEDQIIQFRIINIIKKWIEINWPSLNTPRMKECYNNFVNNLTIINPKLKAHLDKAVQTANQPKFQESEGPRTTPIKPKGLKSKKEGWKLSDFAPEEIARQLTYIDFEYISKIKLDEFLRTRWIKDKAPKLKEASQRVNDLSYWFAQQIVDTVHLKKRAEMITLIIKISKHLLALNSYNSLMAIYLALNFASVARLTQTWKVVDKKHFQFFQKVNKLMSPRNNFKNYRSMIATLSPPMILCQEVLLKDLLYQEEGREDYVKEGVLNMDKMDEIGRIIDQFRINQSKPYGITKLNVLYDYLKSIPVFENPEAAVDYLDRKSQEIEPSSFQFPPHMTNIQSRSMGSINTNRSVSNETKKKSQYSNPKPLSAGSMKVEKHKSIQNDDDSTSIDIKEILHELSEL